MRPIPGRIFVCISPWLSLWESCRALIQRINVSETERVPPSSRGVGRRPGGSRGDLRSPAARGNAAADLASPFGGWHCVSNVRGVAVGGKWWHGEAVTERVVGDGFPVPPSAPQVRRIWLSLWESCLPGGQTERVFSILHKSHPNAINGMGRADMRAFRPLVRPLHDRSANADRSHMTIFSGPNGPKILLTQNQVIMPYPTFHFPFSTFNIPSVRPQHKQNPRPFKRVGVVCVYSVVTSEVLVNRIAFPLSRVLSSAPSV